MNIYESGISPAQRYTFAHNSIVQAHNALNLPTVRRRLGSLADELSIITASSLPVALTPEGIVDIPDNSSERLTVISLGMGEKAVRAIKSDYFDSYQSEALRSTHSPEYINWLDNHQATDNQATYRRLHVFDKELGYVDHQMTTISDTEIVKGRPLLVLNHNISKLPHADAPLFLHEATHVHQIQRSPIERYENGNNMKRNAISDELEAYHVAAMIILGIKDVAKEEQYLSSISPKQIDKALEVELVRRTYATSDAPFAATNEIVGALADRELKITAGIRELIEYREKQKV